MRMQWKYVAIAAFAATAGAGAVAWKTKTTLAESLRAKAMAEAGRETASLRKLTRAKLDSLRSDLVREAAVREATGRSFLSASSPYEVMAIAKPAGDAAGSWIVAWKEIAPGASAERWANGFDATALASLPYARAKDGAIAWARIADAKGDTAFAILFEAELSTADPTHAPTANALPDGHEHGVSAPERRAMVAAIFKGDPLATAVDATEGVSSETFIVDDRGFVAAHASTKNVGVSFEGHSLVAEIVKKQKPAGEGEFTDVDGRSIIARFEAVPGTNLYVARATLLSALKEGADSEGESGLLFGLVAGLISIAGAAWIGGAGRRSGVEDDPLGPDPSSPAVTPDDVRAQSPIAFGSPSIEGIGEALRGPLSSIIGNAQLARAKAIDPESRAHAEAIEREARMAKDALEKVSRLSAPAPTELVSVSLNDALDAAIEATQSELSAAGVTVVRRYGAQISVLADAALLQAAFARVIENAIVAMASRERRTLALEIDQEGGLARVRISDTGIGFTREARARAFEPFYKEFDGVGRLGLGLPFVRQALDAFSARASIESTPGEGASIAFEFAAQNSSPRAESRARELQLTADESSAPVILASHQDDPVWNDEESSIDGFLESEDTSNDYDRSLPLGLENVAVNDAPNDAQNDFSNEPPPPSRPPPVSREEQLDKTMVITESVGLASSSTFGAPPESTAPNKDSNREPERVSVRIRRPKLRG